jgi:hypothetical protein
MREIRVDKLSCIRVYMFSEVQTVTETNVSYDRCLTKVNEQ